MVKRKNLFLAIYFISMLCLFFTISDILPPSIINLCAKMKFVLMITCLLDMIAHRFAYKNIGGNVVFMFLVYCVFCFIFGCILVTPKVQAETTYQLKTTLMMLALIALTYYEVEYYECFNEFMHVSYIAITLFLMLSYITHISESSFNPLYVLKYVFSDADRGRSRFGMGHWNYTGFYIFTYAILALYCFVNVQIAGRFKQVYRVGIIVFSYIAYLMLVSSSSRDPLLSLILLLGLMFVRRATLKINPSERFGIRITYLVLGILVIVICAKTGLFAKAWISRSLNVSINMPIFHQYGSVWKGMGWVETGALQDTVDAFGYGTSSLDLFYVYIYFTTGIIGCVFMAIVYGTIGISIIITTIREKSYYWIALFGSLIFYMFWETILFTIKFWPGLIVVVILLHGMNRKTRPIFFYDINRQLHGSS